MVLTLATTRGQARAKSGSFYSGALCEARVGSLRETLTEIVLRMRASIYPRPHRHTFTTLRREAPESEILLSDTVQFSSVGQ